MAVEADRSTSRSLEFAWGAAHAHRALADACARVGDFEDALRHMDLARRPSLGHMMAEAHYDLAVICEKRGDYDAAVAHATRYLRAHQGAGGLVAHPSRRCRYRATPLRGGARPQRAAGGSRAFHRVPWHSRRRGGQRVPRRGRSGGSCRRRTTEPGAGTHTP
ncbi:tetratricopeptide repeat protein [Allokutzneria albata]|uniref:tetratricopeptide repeat protein n=1 Tax=Allokutzneria albata TaxID=211114 RepID=UPI0009E08BA0